MTLRLLMTTCLLTLMAACTTKMGTNIAADRIIQPGQLVQALGGVSASESIGDVLWAKPADRQLYEHVRRRALALRDGTLLINANITVSLTSYLGLYYRTVLVIDGTAARIVDGPARDERHAVTNH